MTFSCCFSWEIDNGGEWPPRVGRCVGMLPTVPASLILGCEVSCGTRGVTSMGCCCSLDRLLSGLIAIRKVGFAEVSQNGPFFVSAVCGLRSSY